MSVTIPICARLRHQVRNPAMAARIRRTSLTGGIDRRLQSILLAAVCLILPNLAGASLIESSLEEIKVEAEGILPADWARPESRQSGQLAYFLRESSGLVRSPACSVISAV